MLKVGLVGIGFMGRGHLDQYLRLMKEGAPVKLVAICDVDELKFKGIFTGGNMGDLGQGKYDFSQFHCYTRFEEMIEKEDLDYIDIALPTYLHCHYALLGLKAGKHVLCEKPMAMNPEQCVRMISTAKEMGKKLMIAQCLRFWPAYEILKQYVDSRELGDPVAFYFYRGGSTPIWSYQDWLRDEVRSGGALLDQHVHDVDTINWIFGVPKAVSTLAANSNPGAGCDAVSTNYRFDGFVVNAQDDWSQNGEGTPFEMTYRANFTKGNITLAGGVCTVYPQNGEHFVANDGKGDDGYYREICYFIDCVLNDKPIETAAPESTRTTICIAHTERASAANNGEWMEINL